MESINQITNTPILHDSQFGFRPKKSCELALNTMINNWKLAIDKDESIITILLDLSSAFDTVNHDLLLLKLKFYNFSESSLKLMENYLSNRFVITKFGDCKSKSQPFPVGVPQGDPLGPLLFIIYYNDFCYIETASTTHLFADDSTVSLAGNILSDIFSKLNTDLVIISEWLTNNRLILNPKKTNALLISPKPKTTIPTELQVTINGINIPFVKSARLLGVIIDDKLLFDTHVISLCNRINSKIHLLKKSSFMFSESFKTTLFKMFIQTQFDYCSTLFFDNIKNNQLSERLDKCFIRSLNKYLKIKLFIQIGKKYQIMDVYEQAKILSKFKILPRLLRCFYHFIHFVYRNSDLNENSSLIVCLNSHRKPLQTSSRIPFALPNFKTNIYKFSFLTLSIRLLNLFLYRFVSYKYADFKNHFQDYNNLYSSFSSYVKSRESWSIG